MLVYVDKLKLCKGDKPKAWLTREERDATELEDAEEEEMQRPSEEYGSEVQRMEGVEHATTDEARSSGGSEEKPGGHEASKHSATCEHSLGPSDGPGRPTRTRQPPRQLRDYVRAVHAANIERSPIVLENVEQNSKLTREPG